jgi:hypothetical protein
VPDHFAITTVATLLPTVLHLAIAIDMKRICRRSLPASEPVFEQPVLSLKELDDD